MIKKQSASNSQQPKTRSTKARSTKAKSVNTINFNFETSLDELEKLVDSLENDDLSLEQSLHDFERGIHLTRACQNALTDAQQKVQILLDKGQPDNSSPSLEDF
jgi:exodeoxyribonuclease VII small subunit